MTPEFFPPRFSTFLMLIASWAAPSSVTLKTSFTSVPPTLCFSEVPQASCVAVLKSFPASADASTYTYFSLLEPERFPALS